MQNTVQNETSSYALSFGGGDRSIFDSKSSSLFKEFAAKIMNENYDGLKPRTYLGMLQDYDKLVVELDKPFVWDRFKHQVNVNSRKEWIAMVFGECG